MSKILLALPLLILAASCTRPGAPVPGEPVRERRYRGPAALIKAGCRDDSGTATLRIAQGNQARLPVTFTLEIMGGLDGSCQRQDGEQSYTWSAEGVYTGSKVEFTACRPAGARVRGTAATDDGPPGQEAFSGAFDCLDRSGNLLYRVEFNGLKQEE